MSSEISTEPVGLKSDAPYPGSRSETLSVREMTSADAAAGRATRLRQDQSALEPWQFFVLAALGCATAALFASRGQGVTAIVLLTVLMGATALVGMAALRALRPLVSVEEERTSMVGHRTRVALEREKMLALRAIKELEFDRAMGKLSDTDWNEMSGRLRSRAARLMRQLDAGEGYREQIERDLVKRLGLGTATVTREALPVRTAPPRPAVAAAAPLETKTCAACHTDNDADARFCKSCGQAL